ncbi:unnamed protein product, partial [marine sediment metagenome]
FSFYVQAWWRSDLNQFARRYKSYLISNLPPDIIDILRLSDYLKYNEPPEIHNIIAKCRNITNKQINIFAKNKYIKGLYVKRKLQDELTTFHSSESTLAKNLKEASIKSVSKLIMTLSELLKNIKTLENLLKKLLENKKILKDDIKANYKAEDNKLTFKIKESHKIIEKYFHNPTNDLLQKYDVLLNEVNKLSDIDLINQKNHHKSICENIESIVGYIKKLSINKGDSFDEKKLENYIHKIDEKLSHSKDLQPSVKLSDIYKLISYT